MERFRVLEIPYDSNSDLSDILNENVQDNEKVVFVSIEHTTKIAFESRVYRIVLDTI